MQLDLAVVGGESMTVLSRTDWGSSMCYLCRDKDEALLLADRVAYLVELVDLYSDVLVTGRMPVTDLPVTRTRAHYYRNKIEEIKSHIDSVLTEQVVYGGVP